MDWLTYILAKKQGSLEISQGLMINDNPEKV